MKLKKLEITGFKSFFEKATIEFPTGISAVVGPNGCGKSNIIDALRWVMGEQSVKQLRGKSMEDVIFSGTNGKPPLNMAEVSLTLSNENGETPEELREFTEIMLTRRLFRSGESAYFLNKQPCRLKDIHSVFWGSGLGTKSYAVIQQGKIGAITDAGPDELRFFIEEAAGITRYKNRKIEALRKVEITNQNLLRITDIISEIKRQMASLKRQARKAEIYNNYRKQIKTLDLRLGLHYYDDYTRKIEETDALLKELEDLDIGHTTELKKLDAAVEEIKLERWQKNQEISDQKARKFETQRTTDRMENDLVHLRKEIERLAQESDELKETHHNLADKNREMLSEIAQVEKENIQLDEEIKNVKTNLDQERLATQKISDQLSTLNQELESNKASLMDLVAREAQFKNIYQNAVNNKESLKKRLKKSDEDEAFAKQKLSDLQGKESQTRQQLESTKQQVEELNQRIRKVTGQLEQKTKALGNQVKRSQTLELERNTIKSKLSTLKKLEDNYEWYKDGVKAIMTAQSTRAEIRSPAAPAISHELSTKILGLMADVIEPKPSFETAVEAVLGEALQYIIVKDQEAGLKAIDYLQSHSAGRSGFIPVSSVKQVEKNQQDKPDTSKLLVNQISIKPGFEKIVRVLLGQVVYTDNIIDALELFNRNGVRNTIVTKNGDIISPQGILVGGSQDKLNGILAKKQELKDLGRQSTKSDQKLEKARLNQSILESETRNLESHLQKLTEEKSSVTKNEIEAEKALYKVTEELKSAGRHFEIITLEKEQLLGEADDIDEEMTNYNMALADLAAEIKTAQLNVADISSKISTVSAEMEQFNQRTVDLQLQLTALNAKLENSESSLKRLKEFQADSLKRLEQLSEEIQEKQRKEETSKLKVSEHEQTLAEMYQDMEFLEQALKTNEEDYQSIDAKLKDSDEMIFDIKSKREKTLEKFRLLELDQSQRRIKQDNIANRLEEKYQNPFSVLRTEFNQNSESDEITSGKTIEEMEAELTACREKIAKIVDVNLGAIREYEQLKNRYDFLEEQRNDLVCAIEDLHKVIKKINKITQQRFLETFNLINERLNDVFPSLFDGGTAKLILKEPDKPLETGVEFMIHPPGKKLIRHSLLSGGEKALAAIAFIFSIFLIKPAAFCLLDEIDAPLDDANIFRFNDLLQIIGEKSQIIMITHNKRSMEFADTLFGITMEQKGISKIVSVNFEHAGESS